MTESEFRAVKLAMAADLRGITQIDVELTEVGATIMLYGHTDTPEETYVAVVDIPADLAWRLA
ncbi:hypothetical protein [Pseudoruegeria sp. SK021]|uniref:hypothetical protein n=1 Tax=Pseudoruegeria sp. SK021 TaxID=1933035 RepID=UPI000A21CA7B|nr:hypothetical protein [Pseudoruegeria sp. SK021]OSP53824.1 hypothetical protein BV911_15775 [Pseudoruegeria sp. SK021]